MDSRFEKLLNHEDYEIEMHGLKIQVDEGVFSPDPDLTHSTSLLVNHLPQVDRATVADIGCGSGIVSLLCTLKGAEFVIASDISKKAVENTKKNLDSYGFLRCVDVRQSDLFENIPESFDFIFANLPILDGIWNQSECDTVSLIERFLDQALPHLRRDGRIYLPWGSFAEVEPLKVLFSQKQLSVREIQEEKMGYLWYLFEIGNPHLVSF